MVLDAGVGRVRLVADPTGLSASISAGVGGAVKGASGALSAAGSQLMKAFTSPLALAAGAGVILKLGIDFEAAFAKIASVSNASTKDIAQWRDQVLSLSGATAQAPQELADALFFLASAGLKAGQPMQVLEASAKASAVGLGETADVARLTANVLNAYAESGITAAQVTDTLVAAVREGTADADEFTTAIGRLLPIASRAGVGFDQLVGSLAALSNIGLDVNEGVTALRGLLQSIVAPTVQSIAALRELHITTDQLRETLSAEGLPGALNLLEEASGGNIDVLRQLIPNIRALTGELGLTGENADQVALIMIATANAAGSLSKAFRETSRGPAFQFSKAVNDIRVAGTELGTEILPAVTRAIEFIGPVLAFAAKNALALGAAFLTFKVFSALPDLMLKLGASLLSAGTAGQTAGVGLISAGTAMTGFAAATAGATAGIGLLAIAISNSHFAEDLKAAIAPALQSVADLAQAAELADRTGMSFADALGAIKAAAKEAARDLGPVPEIIDGMTTHLDRAGKAVRNFAGLTNKELKGFRQETIKNFSDVAGGIAETGAVFTLTTQEVIRGINRMAAAQHRMAQDLEKLDNLPIGDKLKARLIALGPEAVDGFVRGSSKQRGKIRAGLKVMDEAALDTVHAVKDVIARGAPAAGAALPAGAIKGIDVGSGALIARAHQLGLDTVAALNDAMGNASPSKEGIKAGKFLIDGIVKGIEQRSSKVTEALRALIPLMHEALGIGAADQAKAFLDDFTRVEGKLRSLTKEFDKLKEKISGFRSGIRGAFSDFGDLVGGISAALEQFRQDQEQFLADQAAGVEGAVAPTAPDLHAVVAGQIAQTQLLADLFKKLQKAGLSTANIGQLAGLGGAEAIAEAQALLADPALIEQMNQAQQAFADITQTTADQLTNAAFGDKVAKLGEQFQDLQVHFQHLLERLQGFFQGLGLTVERLKGEEDAFIQGLRRLNNALEGIGVPGGTPNEGGGGGNGLQASTTVNLTVNGWVGNDQDIAQRVREEFVRIRRAGGTV